MIAAAQKTMSEPWDNARRWKKRRLKSFSCKP